ncbi:hypothetical protein E1A91_A04G185600v1 [Gossypium mustelinum]|uniref:SBP-type domain-containing protein n=1 Tax=Gossypium mustelinum TaxID=34275 RepID=A0A5D2ZU20_GOSMU|nr:hypothetical protein E1A91_A04G185600v1 [Gossypium mustelinum]
MDSWSYDCEGKNLFFTDFEAEGMEFNQFMDFSFDYKKKKPFFSNTNLGIFSDEFTTTTSSCYVEQYSSSLMESNSQESSIIDYGDSKGCKETSVVTSIQPVLISKKASITTSSCPQTPQCQVYGCNKDLSSSKDYYKRNKVCEIHSKTAKVIVNGNEMRFCQQCSRFHLLAEFDDGKRSCRKRLVGHNERRRKLHFSTLPGKSHKLLQSYRERYEHADQVKFREKPVYDPQSAISIINGKLVSKKQHIPGSFSSATEAFHAPNELSGLSCSDCALSLLSAQSRDLSSHATGIQLTEPFINQASHHHGSCLENANGFYSCGMNPMGVSQAGSFRDSGLSSPNGTTVDLLQLSTHLQRVEQQRSSMHVKPENEDLFYFLTT